MRRRFNPKLHRPKDYSREGSPELAADDDREICQHCGSPLKRREICLCQQEELADMEDDADADGDGEEVT